MSKRGIAIVTVLMVVSIISLLALAFFHIHRDQIQMGNSAVARSAAVDVCQSGLAYIHCRLESDRSFAAAPFAGDSDRSVEGLAVIESGDGSNLEKNRLKGTFDNGTHFEAIIENNFESREPASSVHGNADIPPFTSRVLMAGVAEGERAELAVLLQKAPFVDGALITTGDLSVHMDTSDLDSQWLISSRDPRRNVIRSGGSLYLPDGDRVRFLAPPHSKGSLNNGQLKARERVHVILDSQGSAESGINYQSSGALSRSELEHLSKTARGRITDQNPDPVAIRDLKASDLALPDEDVIFPGGSYLFAEARVGPKSVPVLVHAVDGRVEKVYMKNPGAEFTGEAFSIPRLTDELPGFSGRVGNGAGVETVTNRFHLPSQGGQDAVAVELGERRFQVLAGLELHVEDRPLEVGFGTSGSGRKPSVTLGTENDPAALVSSHDISIDGTTSGNGALVSGGDISAYAQSSLSTVPTTGLTLLAEGDITLSSGDLVTGVGERARSIDWSLFGEAFSAYPEKETADQWRDLSSSEKRYHSRELSRQQIPSQVAENYTAALKSNFPGLSDEIERGYESLQEESATGLTLSDLVRLRSFTESLSQGEPAGEWLTGGEENQAAVDGIIRDFYSFYSKADRNLVQEEFKSAEAITDALSGRSLNAHFSLGTNPWFTFSSSDARFKGLIYSRTGNFLFQGEGNGIRYEGAVVVKEGDIEMVDARGVHSTFDPDYLHLLLKRQKGQPIKADVTFWSSATR